jgi:trans-aconitate 2-methyltransferase
MAWNPEKYDEFKSERFAPFYDLISLIDIKPAMDVIDLGCGTGELTGKLADKLADAHVLGIDSSAEMLSKTQPFRKKNLRFEQKTIEEQINTDQKWDLIFSNAAIQWVDNHQVLLPKIINTLKPNGQLVIQIPSQKGNALNRILAELVLEKPYQSALNGWNRISPVLETDAYAQIFFENGSKDMTVYEKIYPLIVPGTNELYEWISGTALIPYLEKLTGDIKDKFISEFKNRINQRFLKKPVLYPFKRIILEAKF